MKSERVGDEYIEAVWTLTERGRASEKDLQSFFGENYDRLQLQEIVNSGFALINSSGVVELTESGEQKGRKIIRAHRLAERLLYDVLKLENYELAACEFEHILDTDLIDAICTLLGHPKRSPDGLPIPPGTCCMTNQRTITSPALSVLDLEPEEQGRVIAVHSDHDHQLHVLDLLQIRPGALIRLHQRSPSIVIECDGSSIAVDEQIAGSIFVWKRTAEQKGPPSHQPRGAKKRDRPRRWKSR